MKRTGYYELMNQVEGVGPIPFCHGCNRAPEIRQECWPAVRHAAVVQCLKCGETAEVDIESCGHPPGTSEHSNHVMTRLLAAVEIWKAMQSAPVRS